MPQFFADVLHAWRKSKDSEAPERCEALLAEMDQLGSSNLNLPHCKPDTFAITVRPFEYYSNLFCTLSDLTCSGFTIGLASLLGRIKSTRRLQTRRGYISQNEDAIS